MTTVLNMTRLDIIAEITGALSMAGFYTSEESAVSNPLFDIVARRDSKLLLIKVLKNVDSMDQHRARMLKGVADILQATPLLVGVHTCSRALDDGVVHVRHGITLITPNTMVEYLAEGDAPLVFSGHGGYYSRIDHEAMRELRLAKGLSLSHLARELGVSVRTIQMYETGMCPSVDIAIGLEELLEGPVVQPIDPFAAVSEDPDEDEAFDSTGGSDFHRAIYSLLSGMGYRIVPVMKCPFDAVGRGEKTALIGGIRGGVPDEREMKKNARIISSVSQISEVDGVFFVSRRITTMSSTIEGIPVIGGNEVEGEVDEEDILELIQKRKKENR